MSTLDLTHIALKNCHRNIAHQQGEKCSYWGCQVTQRVGLATRTPDVEAVAVVRIVRRTDQVHTVSSTSSRHRQVIKHDALDLGDEGGQHHAVERRHNTNRAIFDRSTCSLSSSSQLRRTRVMSSVRKMAAKNRCSSRSVAFSAQRLTVAQNSEYLLKVCCLGMVNMKSGSLTPKGLHFLCLSPGDLKNGYFALFCRNCRCAPNLYLAQRYYHRA